MLFSLYLGQIVVSGNSRYKRPESSYAHVPLFGPDQEKITFITLRGTYCYKVMLFGLKNAEATYQQMFKDQLGRTMEAYIDNMVVMNFNEPNV